MMKPNKIKQKKKREREKKYILESFYASVNIKN